MSSTISKGTPEARVDMDAIVRDIANLREDLSRLVTHVRSTTANGASAAVQATREQLSSTVSDAYDAVAARGQESAKALSRQMDEHPLAGILIAFAVGLIGGRTLFR
jgi:ElaB/YqjD/DUF883 family membrane-anchored ribosome-binding protein